MTNSKQNRLDDVTMLFGFGMLLVVLGHSYPDFDLTVLSVQWIYTVHHIIYAFHMPLFFFISWFLYFYTSRGREESYGVFLWKKFKRLLIPYFVISTAAFPIKAAASKHALHPVAFTWHDYAATLIFPWKNTIIFFWFLPTLFLIFCVSPLLRVAIRHRAPWLRYGVAVLLVGINLTMPFKSEAVLNWQGVLHHLVYFYAGMLFCDAHSSSICVNARVWQVLLAVGLFAACFPFSEQNFGRLALAFTGIAISLSIIKPGAPWHAMLLLIGTYSFDIYLLSWFPQIASRIIFYDKLHLGFWISFTALFFFGLIAPILIARFFEKRWTKAGMVFGRA